MGDELVQRFKRLFRSLFLDKTDCAASARKLMETVLLTSQDDADGDDHTGGIVKLSHERADDAASKQQEDQRVLVHLLGKLDVQRV